MGHFLSLFLKYGVPGLPWVGVLLVWARAETILLRWFQANDRVSPALRESYRQSLERLATTRSPNQGPRLWVFPSPKVEAFAFHGLWGVGAIALSQGLLARLDEQALQAILAEKRREFFGWGLRFRTLCHVFLVWCRAITPAPEGLTPVSALLTLLIYPFTQILIRLGSCGRSR